MFDGLAVHQGDADLEGGGEFSANRAFLRAGAIYSFGNGAAAGLVASFGEFDYDFGTAANEPWQDVRDIRLSVPIRWASENGLQVLVSPQLRWDYERGASASDGFTYGAFAGVSWQLNPALRIGPAFGVFSEVGTGDLDVFPALLVDWDISDRWNLSTGGGLGATQGPGLSLSYAVSEQFRLGLAVRSERVRFQLNDSGPAPGGVGEDRSIPAVVSLDYTPTRSTSISVFVGAEFDGELRLDDATGREVGRQTYDTAPIAGLAVRVLF
ncbi:hypothetical protein FGK63_11370 [Ruegeria sediminis]|uniref:DUF6268 domain-containing protein n=1 Tax=Ruegeria sediminis TaxID=2583820 RepID=A0ABY2WZU0_9RHOB|nr:hypothetical protein FGK63_11370 [Ruegeria sediminis]